MNNAQALSLCPACRKGHVHAVTRTEVFRPRGAQVTVALLASKCDACGVQTTRASQHEENLRRLAARKPQYGNVLMGEEIVALRKRYGLTQQAAAKIFGKGKIAFSRYENEVSYPDDSTTLLLTLAIDKPDSLKWLADKAGVALPLWSERCKEGRQSLRLVSDRQAVPMAVHEQTSFPALPSSLPESRNGWHDLPPRGRGPVETYKSQRRTAREMA